MWCARYHMPLPASSVVLNRQAKQKESRVRRKQVLFLLSSSSPSNLREHQWRRISNYPKIGLRLKAKASVVPPSESGDITTFLLVSGVMLSMYMIANFVVPSMLFKSLQGEEEEDSD